MVRMKTIGSFLLFSFCYTSREKNKTYKLKSSARFFAGLSAAFASAYTLLTSTSASNLSNHSSTPYAGSSSSIVAILMCLCVVVQVKHVD